MSGEKISIVETIILSCFGGVGGVLSYLMRTLNDDKVPKLGKLLVEGFSSAFVGLLAMLACKALGADPLWSGVVVGVFGWVGAEASIVMLSKLIRQRLGVENGSNKNGSS